MAPLPNKKIFRYRTGRLVFLYALAGLATMMMTAASVGAIVDWQQDREQLGALWFGAVWACCALGAIWLAWQIYVHSRPVSLDGSGIVSYSPLSAIRSQIFWKDVTRIEQRRFYQPLFSRHEFSTAIFGPEQKISFGSTILGYPNLISELNDRMKQFGLVASFVDLGQDTRQRLLTTTPPSHERKEALRKGVVQEVTRLTADDPS